MNELGQTQTTPQAATCPDCAGSGRAKPWDATFIRCATCAGTGVRPLTPTQDNPATILCAPNFCECDGTIFWIPAPDGNYESVCIECGAQS